MRNLAPAATLAATLLAFTACGHTGNTPASESQAAAAESQDGVAKLRPDTTFVDFGCVSTGEIISKSIVVTNSGTRSAQVTSVSTDCQCLAARIDDDALPPGQATRLRLEYDTHGTLGREFHKVTVRTDAAEAVEIVVTADVQQAY